MAYPFIAMRRALKDFSKQLCTAFKETGKQITETFSHENIEELKKYFGREEE